MSGHGDARWRILPLLIPLVLLAGCVEPDTHIVIEMRGAGTRLERHLEFFRIDPRDTVHGRHLAPVVDSVLASRLARAYGVAPDTLHPYVVTRRFREIPADVGNFGHWVALESPFGTTYDYAERFGGDPHPAETLAAQQRSTDTLLAMVHDWCAIALPPGNRWPRLTAFLDQQMPRDARDLVLLSWMTFATNDPDAKKRTDYYWLENPGAIVVNKITSKGELLGLFFTPPSRLDDRHRRMRERWLDQCEAYLGHPERMSEEDIETPEPDSATCELGRSMIDGLPGYPGDDALLLLYLRAVGGDHEYTMFANDLKVRLVTGIAPTTTNGTWDSTAAVVTWPVNTALSEPGAHPVFCEATWAMPDSARQIARFDSVRVNGERLDRYCRWYRALTPARRGEWDRMMATVRPGDSDPIERFRFGDERMAPADTTGHRKDSAQTGREAILGPARP